MSFQKTISSGDGPDSASERATNTGQSMGASVSAGDHQTFKTNAPSNAPFSSSVQGASGRPQLRGGQLVSLHLLGPISLQDRTGKTLTPRGQKAQAILGLLALAPRGQRTRAWLRDKLWSDSDEKRASSSLRQSLFEIKRDIGDLVDQILIVDRYSIGLRMDAIWVDVREIPENTALFAQFGLTSDIELLEGIDISDPEFEDWLTMERQIWYDKAVEIEETAEVAPVVSKPASPRPAQIIAPQPLHSLGFLPSIQNGCQPETKFLADYVVESVAKNLHEFQPISMCDFRESSNYASDMASAGETDFYIRTRTLQVGNSLTLTLFLYRATQINMEWSQSIQVPVSEAISPDGIVLNGFISQNVDRIAKSVFEDGVRPSELEHLHRAGYSALNLMFRLDENDFSMAETLLAHPCLQQQNSIYPALQSYLTSFNVGENLGDLDGARSEAADRLLTEVVDDNPFNAIALACLGHVTGYVFKEHEMAESLLERALLLNKTQAFVWDHYALHKIYTGQYSQAMEAAKNASYLGAYSPISYSYDVTHAMAATMVGEHGQAVARCKTALRKQPRSAAALRYLLINFAMQNRHEEAEQVYSRLLEIDPDFSNPDVQADRFRLADKDMQQTFLTSIKQLPKL